MNIKLNFSIALFCVFFAQNGVACDEPESISIPDGATATEEDMSDAGERYHQFMVDMQLYQVCLEGEASVARRDARNLSNDQIRQRENAYAARHNAASSAMKAATADFETAIAAYKARQ